MVAEGSFTEQSGWPSPFATREYRYCLIKEFPSTRKPLRNPAMIHRPIETTDILRRKYVNEKTCLEVQRGSFNVTRWLRYTCIVGLLQFPDSSTVLFYSSLSKGPLICGFGLSNKGLLFDWDSLAQYFGHRLTHRREMSFIFALVFLWTTYTYRPCVFKA